MKLHAKSDQIKNSDDLWKKFDALRTDELHPINATIDKDAAQSEKVVTEHSRKVSLDLLNIQSRLDFLAASALDGAQAEKMKKEKQLDTFTRLSYVLFTVGWCLAIVAKLRDIELSDSSG